MCSDNNKKYQGSCLCGAIQYGFDSLESEMANCHCTMCRKFHGAAFATFATVQCNDLTWHKGNDFLVSYRADNGTTRQFCQQCGSSLTFSSPNAPSETIEIAVASVDVDLEVKPDAHIFADFKANWYDIDETLPVYSEGRNSKCLK